MDILGPKNLTEALPLNARLPEPDDVAKITAGDGGGAGASQATGGVVAATPFVARREGRDKSNLGAEPGGLTETALGHERGDERVGAVAETFRGGEHLLRRRPRNHGVAAERKRNGGLREAEAAGDVVLSDHE